MIQKVENTNETRNVELGIYDKLRLGIKKYGYDSEFRKEYESMTQQLRHGELNEFFDKWGVTQ
jgi:hypothetical protein